MAEVVPVLSLFSTHYLWLALGASAINSAVLCVAAGVAAKTDGVPLVLALLLLVIASHLLSCLYFLSGQGVELAVHRLLDRDSLHAGSSRFKSVIDYMQRYRRRYIFMYRFIPGLRFISPYIMGLEEGRFWRFFVIDWFAALLWVSVFGVLGVLCGAAAERALDNFADYDGPIFGAVAVLVLLFVLARRIHRRRRRRGA